MKNVEYEMTMTSQHKSIWTDLTRVPFTQGYLDAGGVRTRYLAAGDEDKPLLQSTLSATVGATSRSWITKSLTMPST